MASTFAEKKVQLVYDNLNDEKKRKQAFTNLTEEASDENIIAFAKIIGSLATDEEPLNSLFIIESTHHTL